jgi:hypothetical protein
MKRKILVILIFAALGVSMGYLVSGTSISISEGVKSFYKKKQEELLAESDPLVIYAKDVHDGREVDWDPDESSRRLIIIGDLPFPRLYGEGGFSIKDAARLAGIVVPVAVLFILLFRRYQKKKKDQEIDRPAESLQESNNPGFSFNEEQQEEEVSNVQVIHEVRKLLKEWENNLPPGNKKRYHETISEWFYRIGGPTAIIPVYEKIRYGYGECTLEEYMLIKKVLNT